MRPKTSPETVFSSSGLSVRKKLAEDIVVQFLVLALGQDAAQAVVVRLDGLHGPDDGPGAVLAVGQCDEVVKLGFCLEEDSAFLGEVLLGECPSLAAARGQVSFDVVSDRQVATVGVAQEDEAHDGEEVLVARVVRVGAQGIRCAPEALLNGFDVLELRHTSTACCRCR